MGFGLNQISNPTPSIVNLIARIYTVTIGTFLGWMATTDLINDHSQHILSGWLGLSLMLINAVAPLFGIQINQNKISTSSVTAVDTTKLN